MNILNKNSEIFSQKPEQMSAQILAFVGDAVYELMVRDKIIHKYSGSIGQINTIKVKNVCCEAQCALYEKVKDLLTNQETEIFKRGRNLNSINTPKNASPIVYRKATGLEALFGFLYLKGQTKRMKELIDYLEL